MTRGIISKFLVVLIVLFTAQSVFWFFKTSAVKKHTLATISSSNGKIGAVAVSVSGFPFNQKLKIDNLRFEVSSLPGGTQLPGKYQIGIKNFEASTNIFSSDFVVNAISDVSFQDKSGVTNSVEFNQTPKVSFSISGAVPAKFSYQDAGYKIVDLSKNVLFENGSSTVNFESVMEGEKFHQRVKAEFRDVSIFGLANNPPAESAVIQSDIATATQPANAPEPAAPDFATNTEQPVVAPQPTTQVGTVANQDSGLIKKNIIVDVEYVLATASASTIPSTPDNINDGLIDDQGLRLESMNVKKFEISSPLYKFDVNGSVTAFKKDSFPIGSLSARVEKLDNVLIYLKKYFPDITASSLSNNTVTTPAPVADIMDGNVQSADIKAASTPSSDSATTPASNQRPVDIAVVIRDLSKKNVATNDDVAVFDFRQEVDKDLVINETPLPEIIGQFFLSSMGGDKAADAVPAPLDSPVAPDVDVVTPTPTNVNNIAPVAPAPAQVPVPVAPAVATPQPATTIPTPPTAPTAPQPVAPPAPAQIPAVKTNNANQ